jgi:DNA-binding response OmpR family regulator
MREHPLILTVEDEPRISRYLRSSLQMAGYDVLVASDGVKAIELVQENQPDLVLLDLGLPRMGGFEVLEHIRKQFDMPVIVLTALDTEEDKVKALMMGADDYLPKPFGNGADRGCAAAVSHHRACGQKRNGLPERRAAR